MLRLISARIRMRPMSPSTIHPTVSPVRLQGGVLGSKNVMQYPKTVKFIPKRTHFLFKIKRYAALMRYSFLGRITLIMPVLQSAQRSVLRMTKTLSKKAYVVLLGFRTGLSAFARFVA